ncbi:hypothetical protein DIPPA_28880 [Diplonema papillatum]|nr:hypothetical protein DIPPA_28880 [Diplonema papillatum]
MIGCSLGAMHRHPEVSAIAVEACTSLYQLTRTPQLCVWLVEDGVVLDYFVEALTHHKEHTDVVTIVTKMLLVLQTLPRLHAEVRKSNAIPVLLQAGEIHGGNRAVAALVLETLLPHVAFFPSRVDDYTRCVRKIMSSHAEPAVLSLACDLVAAMGRACPDDRTKLRISRYLVPYVAATLQTYTDDDELQRKADAALASLVIHKWSTDLGCPRRRVHVDPVSSQNTLKHPSSIKRPMLLLLSQCSRKPLQLNYPRLATL